MNLGQTMITMGMFVLLVMSVISANRMLVQNAESNLQTEALTASATLANDVFQEALSMKYDEYADTTGTQTQMDFSSPSGGAHSEWGPSSSEREAVGPMPDSCSNGSEYRSLTAFNDVDDYIGYTRFVNADSSNGLLIGGFIITMRVYYVDPNDPDVAVNYQTFVKRIEVDVEHPKYLAKITYSSLMSY